MGHEETRLSRAVEWGYDHILKNKGLVWLNDYTCGGAQYAFCGLLLTAVLLGGWLVGGITLWLLKAFFHSIAWWQENVWIGN